MSNVATETAKVTFFHERIIDQPQSQPRNVQVRGGINIAGNVSGSNVNIAGVQVFNGSTRITNTPNNEVVHPEHFAVLVAKPDWVSVYEVTDQTESDFMQWSANNPKASYRQVLTWFWDNDCRGVEMSTEDMQKYLIAVICK